MNEGTLSWATLELVTLFALSPISCASSSATHPPSAVGSAAAKREWSSGVRTQIRDYWNPWDVVQAAKVSSTEPSPSRPTTVLRIAVQRDGTAPRPQILSSSGSSALDDAAVRAVAAALPLPVPPPELLSGASFVPFDLGFRVVRNELPTVPPEDDAHDAFAVISASCENKTPGTVAPTEVQRTVEDYQRDVAVCLDRQHAEGLDPVGQVMVEFVIAESGTIYHPIVLRTSGLTRPLEGCLLKAMHQWAFPKPTGGAVKVAIPFRFGVGQALGADLRSRH